MALRTSKPTAGRAIGKQQPALRVDIVKIQERSRNKIPCGLRGQGSGAEKKIGQNTTCSPKETTALTKSVPVSP